MRGRTCLQAAELADTGVVKVELRTTSGQAFACAGRKPCILRMLARTRASLCAPARTRKGLGARVEVHGCVLVDPGELNRTPASPACMAIRSLVSTLGHRLSSAVCYNIHFAKQPPSTKLVENRSASKPGRANATKNQPPDVLLGTHESSTAPLHIVQMLRMPGPFFYHQLLNASVQNGALEKPSTFPFFGSDCTCAFSCSHMGTLPLE